MADKLRLRWAGHIARLGEHGVHISFGKGRVWNENRHRGERIILKGYVSEIISLRCTIKMVDTPLSIYFLNVITYTTIYK
jgi:hypothetical protein